VIDLAVAVVVLDITFEVWVAQNEESGQSDRPTRLTSFLLILSPLKKSKKKGG
jgi:hypothetical protein